MPIVPSSRQDEAQAFASRAVTTLSEAGKAHKPKDASDEYWQKEVFVSTIDKARDIFATNQNYVAAEKMYLEAIKIREDYATENWPSKPNNEDFSRFLIQDFEHTRAKVADSDDKLGRLYVREGKFQEALRQYQKSEAIREKQFGPDRPPVAQSLRTWLCATLCRVNMIGRSHFTSARSTSFNIPATAIKRKWQSRWGIIRSS